MASLLGFLLQKSSSSTTTTNLTSSEEASSPSHRGSGEELPQPPAANELPAGLLAESTVTGAKSIVSILSDPSRRFTNDRRYRRRVRRRCAACLAAAGEDPELAGVLRKLELGMNTVEHLAAGSANDARIKSLRNCIRLLSVVESLNAGSRSNIGGDLSAIAQLYLAFTYFSVNNEGNRVMSARHTVRVFSDSPSMARVKLLPELWERLFVPHLVGEEGHDAINEETALFAAYYQSCLMKLDCCNSSFIIVSPASPSPASAGAGEVVEK